MMRICVLLSLLSLASATKFTNSMVLTSADIPVNQAQRFDSLKTNGVYRIYATFASGFTNDYASKVFISDDTGARFSVAGLATPNPNTVYFLDNLRTLRAPITVEDTNIGGIAKVPYVIYIVDASFASFPVVSARDVGKSNNIVDSNNAFVAAGVTVLSADKMFTMNGFNMYGLSNMVISSVGFDVSLDEASNKYNILSVSSWEASQSFLTVYGPIATLFNTNWGWNARFSFTLRFTPYTSQLSYGAAFALMSPGYLSKDERYNIDYTVPEALTASYQWSGNNFIGVDYSVKDIQGETMNFQITTADGQVTTMALSNDANNKQWQWANRVSLNVQGGNGVHVPRFLYKITSGASFSFSLVGVLLVSLFSKLY